ncbi:hypothetical protein [Paraburkholderia sp.]|uniref:hypothetical protein n=1 Tax=Paraburkholderia sp. TaxID=1926495 RepID=UPI003C7B95D0
MQVHSHNLDCSKHNVKKHLSHALDISCSNSGMDIYSNRRRWLAHWIDTEYGGNKARAAEATGYSRSQISQFLSDSYQEGRSPQEKAARTLEHRFKKPDRIMETPAPGTALPTTSSNEPSYPGDVDGLFIRTAEDGTHYMLFEIKRPRGSTSHPESQMTRYFVDLPDYVVAAHNAVMEAHCSKAPREVFDAVAVLFSQLRIPESGSIDAPRKDETERQPSAASNMKEHAERAKKGAESRLATRSGGTSGAQKVGGKRPKSHPH